MKNKSYFPIRLFRWFLFQQIVITVGAFLLLAFLFLGWLELQNFDGPVLSEIKRAVVLTFVICFVAILPIFFWMAWRLLVPLGRLIEKSLRLRESPLVHEDQPEALTFDEPGEWYELERAINRLGRELRQKTIRLSREKTELRAIMSAVNEAVLAIAKDRRILFYNPQFTYSFGVTPGSGDVRLTEVLRAPDIVEAYENVLLTGVGLRKEVEVGHPTESTSRYFALSVAPLKKKHNQEVYGVVGIFHEITELKKAERIRIEFVGNVSHELRTPLTAISGYLQTLDADVEKGHLQQAKKFLKIISTNVARLRSLVEDLLDLSSLESGKDLEFEKVNVQEMTESVLGQIQVRTHDVKPSYDFQEMQADPRRLEQVLRNLIENAVRYVPEGGKIDIQWTKSNGHLQLRVKDNGPGIAPKHLERLFERFYRVDDSRSRAVGGTGIGLSLVKHIVQRHGGQVKVQSQLGQGAEFVCEFPVH